MSREIHWMVSHSEVRGITRHSRQEGPMTYHEDCGTDDKYAQQRASELREKGYLVRLWWQAVEVEDPPPADDDSFLYKVWLVIVLLVAFAACLSPLWLERVT